MVSKMAAFNCIVCDCPWSMKDGLTMGDTPRGAISNYSLLDTNALCKLDVPSIVDPNGCILVLWALGSMLEDALQVMKAWGFQQKQILVWVKTKKQPLQNLKKTLRKSKNIENDVDSFDLNDSLSFGMGRLWRASHEIALIGINSTKIYKELKNKSQRSVLFHENTKHSKKPESIQDSLELMFPNPNLLRLEIFARRQRKGWVCVGNESVMTLGEDITISLNKLKTSLTDDVKNIINNYSDDKAQELRSLWNGTVL